MFFLFFIVSPFYFLPQSKKRDYTIDCIDIATYKCINLIFMLSNFTNCFLRTAFQSIYRLVKGSYPRRRFFSGVMMDGAAYLIISKIYRIKISAR